MFAGLLKKLRAAIFLSIAFVTVLGAMPAQAAAPVVRSTYIVTIKEGSNDAVRSVIAKLGETAHDELTQVLDGFILDMTETEVSTLQADPNVIRIEADAPMSLLDTQNPTPSWGLDRIDQTNTTYDSKYTYPASAGTGVNIYIVDTGVMASNPDFAGRIQSGADMLGQNLQGADCNGHGTHVAGTAAGTTYGVAKKATIIPVRVLACNGSGSWSYFISALDWVAKNNPVGTPAVMSASLGGSRIQSVNDAIQNLYAAGVTPVVAAGNSADDACKYSPASAPNAITVGATDYTDARAYYSNFGDCVDVFAPGSNIISDNYLDPTTSRSLSGTSMATPHVSGLAALYLANNPTSTPAQVLAAIQAGAQSGVVTNALTTNNLLINNGFIKAALPPVGSPTGVTVSNITSTSATVTWSAPVGTAAAQSYNVEYKASTAATWTTATSLTTTASLTGLTGNTNYSVRVSSVDGTTVSAPSAESMFVTKGLAPSAPTNLRTTSVFGDTATITWDVANGNGSAITAYSVYSVNGSTRTLLRSSSSTTFTWTGLTPQTSYSMQIEATNAMGTSPASATFTFTTTSATPAQVGRVTFSNITATTATATWAAVPQLDANTPITYKVSTYVYTTLGYLARTTYTTTTPTVALTGLIRAATQLVYVTAYSGTLAGPISLGYSFNTPANVPGVVSSFTATKTGNTTRLDWLAPGDTGGSALTGFVLEKQSGTSWVSVASGNTTFQTYTVPTPNRGVTDVYRVAAVNALGTGAYKSVNVTNAITAPAAPQNLTATQSVDLQSVTLSWAEPADNGGAPVTSYRVVYGTAAGATNSVAVNVPVGQTTVTLPIPTRGAAVFYAVQAINSVGIGALSTSVSVTRPAVVPSAPASISAAWNPDGSLRITWSTPSDNGGSAITGYILQRLESGSWVTKYTGTANTTNLPREAAGSVWQYQVIASNAVGSSLPSKVLTSQVPVALASAPQNFSAVDSGQVVQISYSAPLNLGGGTLSYYEVSVSRDGGNTWQSLASTSALQINVSRPTKGQTWLYRVAAANQAGVGAATAAISITAATTLPAVTSTSATFASDGSINIKWYLYQNDNGGLALTGYKVEKSYDNVNWAQILMAPATQTSYNVPRENPGVRAYFRVSAINSLGAGAANVTSIQVPYLKASAPQNVVIVDSGTSVVATYGAPASLGGSATVSYYLQTSKDGGTTWSGIAVGSQLTLTGSRPAKGTSQLYRVIAYTAYGYSDASAAVTITSAATAPGASYVSSFVLNADKSMSLTWRVSTDNGGSPITATVLYTSTDGTNWTAGASVAPSVLTYTLPAAAPGVRTYVRLVTLNAVGASVPSGSASLLNPYLPATAVNNLAGSVANNLLTVSWTAPSNLGGAPSVAYQVFTSTDGVTWTQRVYTSAIQVSVAAPAKGTTVQVRVVPNTSAGPGAATQISVLAPTTVTNAVASIAVARVNATTVNVAFTAPTDLGGLTTWNYKVQVLQNGSYVTVATGVGAATNLVAINLAQLTNTAAAYQVRVIANNTVGDSAASYTVQVR